MTDGGTGAAGVGGGAVDGVATGGVVGVGTDLVEVDRLRTALERTPGLVHRLFTPAEQSRCARNKDPLPHLAARFAAKEAVMKALGRGMSAMAFTDIEVVTDATGAPSVRLAGRARQVADAAGVQRWSLSLTHDGGMAHAIALAHS